MDSDKYQDLGRFLDDIQLYREGELCLFRGQSCNKPLLPKIARRDPTVDTSKIEREMLAATAGGIVAVSAAGTTVGLSAAGITRGLAAAGKSWAAAWRGA